MKRFSILAVALLLTAACSQSPTGVGNTGSGEPAGRLSLAVGPNVDLILDPGSTSELPALVADAWREQQTLNLQEIAAEAVELVMIHNPSSIEVTESWLIPAGSGKSIPGTSRNAEFALMLQEELDAAGLKYKILQTEVSVDRVLPMALVDHAVQDMRLMVCEVLLSREGWIP